jgi:putative ABC transport system permease protein
MNFPLRHRFRKRQARERDLDRELRAHLELETEERQAAGVEAREARDAAQRAFGNTTWVKEATRDMWGWASLEQFSQDVRYGSRLLLRSPALTVVAVLTLALGIGADTAIFSLVEGLLLKPLPYRNAEQLVVPATIFARTKSDRGSVALADVLDWKALTDLFEAVSAYQSTYFDITGAEEPEHVRALLVDEAYFRVIGSPPLLGHTFTAAENLPGNGRVVVVSYGLWMRRFGGDPTVVGRPIELNGVANMVVGGVMPKDSTWPEDAEIFAPFGFGPTPPASLLRRDNHIFGVVARLRAGVTLERAQAKLTVMGARVARENTNRAGTNWKLHPLTEWIIGPTLSQTLWILLSAALLVLLIACVNVANLLLARGAAREREVAIRGALGAGWKRLASQFLVESALLAAAGGLAGIALGYWGLKGLIHFAPSDVPRLDHVRLDGVVLGFAAGLCLLTTLVSGLMPAVQAARLAPVEAFREGGRALSGGLRSGRLRNLLAVSEMALAIVLLAGAGLLIRSFAQLQRIAPGFSTNHLLTMQVGLPRARYAGPPQLAEGFQRLTESIRRIPGVVSASATSTLPLGGGGGYLLRVFLLDGQAEPPATQDTPAQWSVVEPDYFHTMGIPVLQGRAFTDRDVKGALPVIVISQRMAQQMFPNQSPLGRRIRSWRDENLYREIVGVAGDLNYFGRGEDMHNNVYVPLAQDSRSTLRLTVRTSGDPNALLGSVRSAIWSVDTKLAIAEVKTMDRIVDEDIARPRFSMFLLGIFAATALLLAAIGIYGVMSYAVTQRTREIGIRVALGALRGDVLRMVAGRAFALACAGVVCGMAGAFALTRLMKSLLFGVSPTDGTTFAAVAALLVLVALAASYIPARRAAKVDPVITLRYE